MRLFEYLLLFTNLLVILWPAIPARRPTWLRYLPVTAFLLTLIHLLIEKYRWQMVPAYSLTLVLFILEIWRWRKDTQTTNFGWTAVVKNLPGLLFFAFALALPSLMPVPKLLDPTGPFAIGTKTYHMVDTSRDEFYTPNPKDKREFMAQIWYPAITNSSATAASYFDRLDIAGPAFSTWLNLPSFLLDHINLTSTQSYFNLAIVSESPPFPIIIFTHGLHGFRAQNTTMIQELVSHGYVVASIDHTFGNMISVFPDGRVTFFEPTIFSEEDLYPPRDGKTLMKVWAEDNRYLLKQIIEWNDEPGNLFYGRLNLSQIGAVGHSAGGGTTLEFCLNNNQCQAGIALDSWVEPLSLSRFSQGLPQPFMFMNTPDWLGTKNREKGKSIYHNLNNSSYLLTISNTDHYDFSDISLLSPLTPQLGITGSIDGPYSLAIQNSYVRAFFDMYLKGIKSSLLAGEKVYPEVVFDWNGR